MKMVKFNIGDSVVLTKDFFLKSGHFEKGSVWVVTNVFDVKVSDGKGGFF